MSRDSIAGTPSAVSTLPAPAEAARSFEKVKPELLSLRPDEVRRVTAQIPHAVTIALGAIPRLDRFRAEIALLPRTPIAALDDLEAYALATYYAHLLTLPSPKDEAEKKVLLEEARPLRGALLTAAEALAARDLVDAALVAKIRSGTGSVDAAGDLIALAVLFTDAWPKVENNTAVTVEEVQRAGDLGTRLLLALSRDEPPKETTGLAPVELRARTFTLLSRAYDECRRAMEYLRYHEGDADVIAPSLFTRAARGKKAADPRSAEVAIE